MKWENLKKAGRGFILVGFILSQTIAARACGPDFPNEMLDRGDDAVLAAPIADFYSELERIQLMPPRFRAVLTTNDYTTRSIEADLADLRRALGRTALSQVERERIAASYETARVELATSQLPQTNSDDGSGSSNQTMPQTKLPPKIHIPDGLPGEFADYFRGRIAWEFDQTNEARVIWETLLARPESERRYRSTWATYMLGKCWQDVDAEKAIQYFQKVRALAAAGFADRLGLAASSIGWEAQEELKREHFDRAIQLYLQQLASGDGTAKVSLRLTAAQALRNGGDQLTSLATNADSRRVITAFITSRINLESLLNNFEWGDAETNRSIVIRWLDAVESANVTDVESAEQLALAAYQAGQWKLAQRWLDRAKTTPVTEWLEAKLLLRSGKVQEAAALLEKVARNFPLDPGVTNGVGITGLKDTLYLPGSSYTAENIDMPSQVRAEIGVLRLARREYTESLDALLRSGFWMDAAYVAERVLTLDELKSYVDRSWPPVAPATNVSTNAEEKLTAPPQMDLRREIRYLLARRLTRMYRGTEARDYYPAEEQSDYDALMQHLSIVDNTSFTAEQRSATLFAMAKLVRHRGMELIGTEVEPDWHVNCGGYVYGVTIASRPVNDSTNVILATEEELVRAQQHGVNPDARFHYRYLAAALAWEAAGLMPNNSDETARVLCTGGTWIKVLNPQTADIFYKSLVRRCRKTELGQLADRMRWFPKLDENGKIVPWIPDPPQEMEQSPVEAFADSAQRTAGYWYVLNPGNSLQDVVEVANAAHQLTLTANDVQQANPHVNPNRLKIGQKIFVPAVPPQTTQIPEQETQTTINDGSGPDR